MLRVLKTCKHHFSQSHQLSIFKIFLIFPKVPNWPPYYEDLVQVFSLSFLRIKILDLNDYVNLLY
jgi:hypothetical protein